MNALTNDLRRAMQKSLGFAQGLDFGFVWVARVCAIAILGLLIWLSVQIGIEAYPAIRRFGWQFLITDVWNPVTDQYGALPLIYGTLITSLIALLLAWPVGIGVAIFLSEDFLPNPVRTVLTFLVELLAAVPSVVYGLWGIFVLIPILQVVGVWLHENFGWLPIFSTYPTGPGILPAGVILAIMILPTIAVLSRQVFRSLRDSGLREAAYGVGATRWETIFRVLLPAGASGILGATVLAIGRAMGETMAV
ncbi:MAG: phosphate ABC transporter permease subunit PstC, partial [Leptolyngbyaceae bacterium]|nr:phosphate ABC transporter permease subunit PstC [Leptolyngbyaceae bacterium]